MTRHYYAQKTMLSEHPSHAAVTAGVSLYARTSSRTWRSVLLAALCHTAQIRQQGVAIVYGQICQLTHEVDALREETALLFRTGHIQVPAILKVGNHICSSRDDGLRNVRLTGAMKSK
mmetsp:Transcript_6142/g.15866  ORF Transcript_6142/g.15866 Transcript_6142/m.15866 type:complete len:118 (-) Transcript_6142:2303-2656(-)